MYLPSLPVHLEALFHLVLQAHHVVQEVLNHQEDQHYQGVREAHPCPQALHYQGDLDYPTNFRKKSMSCIILKSTTYLLVFIFPRESQSNWFNCLMVD